MRFGLERASYGTEMGVELEAKVGAGTGACWGWNWRVLGDEMGMKKVPATYKSLIDTVSQFTSMDYASE